MRDDHRRPNGIDYISTGAVSKPLLLNRLDRFRPRQRVYRDNLQGSETMTFTILAEMEFAFGLAIQQAPSTLWRSAQPRLAHITRSLRIRTLSARSAARA